MLEDIYNAKIEEIDNCIKSAIKKVEQKLYKIENEEKNEITDKIEENCNIKLGAICKELYIKGLKDGINLINECKDKNQ